MAEKKVVKERKEEKKEENVAKTAVKKPEPKKKEAVANGRNLSISKKHAMAICKMIRGKKIQDALMDLELVLKFKKVVPMKGEIPHRKGKGIMSGRYPINATKIIISLLKSLDANARVLEINDPIISLAKADRAARPYRRFGSRRFKRANVLLQAKEK